MDLHASVMRKKKKNKCIKDCSIFMAIPFLSAKKENKKKKRFNLYSVDGDN